MPAERSLNPYRPFRPSNPTNGIEKLPNENVIPPLEPEHHAQPTLEELTPPPPPPPPTPPPPPIEKDIVAPRRTSLTAVFLFSLLSLLAALGIFSYFKIQPQLLTLSLAKELGKPSKNLVQSFGKASQSLTIIVQLITQGSASPPPATSTQGVLGESTSLPSPAYPAARAEDEYTNELRLLKEASLNAKMAIMQVEKDLDILQNRLPITFPDGAQEMVRKSQEAALSVYSLIPEFKKVVDYYSTITSVEIDLLPTVTSIVNLIVDLASARDPSLYLDKLESLRQTVEDLETRTQALGAVLPEGLEKVQEDNLKTFTIITILLSDIEKSITKYSFKRFSDAVQKMSIDLEVVSTRAKTLELSFWQETGLLKRTQAIEADLSKLASQIEVVRQENRLLFFR